ncbi:serine/threonine protein kinase [bacterium]|nr:serine/threonine protein kinase [bacterium]
MAEYIERIEQGESADPADYLHRYPQHAAELTTFFKNHHWLDDTEPETSTLVGQTIGPFMIEAELARGGMGVVYKAKQTSLERIVALKLISSGLLAGEEEKQRFRIEAEAAAGLQHPCIIPIHEIGSWQGYEFFSMPLIEGKTLQQYVNQNILPERRVAEIILQIAEAVTYAHAAGIIHRDLKPDNILMNLDGHPLLTDFGLAKWHREGATLTRTGQVLGTPHYMSPEQASGKGGEDTSTDIYSLGAILYAMLTGIPPHPGDNMAEVLRSVLQDEPKSPRSIRREISVEIEQICLKAIQYEPSERYPTAKILADDIRRFLAGETTMASSGGLLDRVAREIRRDQHQNHFEHWGRALFVIGLIVFTSHLAMFFLTTWDNPSWVSFWIPRAVMLSMIAAVIAYARGGNLLPRSVADRPVYSIWVAYLLTLATLNILTEISEQPSDMFTIASALSGFGFLAMSGHIWGGASLFGVGFLCVAAISHIQPILGPLLLGGMWLLSCTSLAIHYDRRAKSLPSGFLANNESSTAKR